MTKTELMEHRIQYYKAPVSNAISNHRVGISNLFDYITGTYYKQATDTLRSIADPALRRTYKTRHFDFVCFSGLFAYRRDESLLAHSNLLCLDFDHIAPRLPELRERLPLDPYFETELLFTSPSGDGLKWVVEIDTRRTDHRTWFRALSAYVHETYGLESDPACINLSRACFLPQDTNAYVNPLICPF